PLVLSVVVAAALLLLLAPELDLLCPSLGIVDQPTLLIALIARAFLAIAADAQLADVSLVPLALPLADMALGISTVLCIEPAQLPGVGRLALDIEPVSTHPVLARPRDPHVAVVAVIAHDRHARVEIAANVGRHVMAVALGR